MNWKKIVRTRVVEARREEILDDIKAAQDEIKELDAKIREETDSAKRRKLNTDRADMIAALQDLKSDLRNAE